MTIEDDSASLTYSEWKLFIDKASGSQGSGVGIILIGPNKIQIRYVVKLKYNAANNEAEYEALLTRLKLAIEVRAEHLKVYSDSQLVVNQVKGIYQVKEMNIVLYIQKVKQLLKKLEQEGDNGICCKSLGVKIQRQIDSQRQNQRPTKHSRRWN